MTEYLNYYKGKLCSIFTVPINRNFKEEQPNIFPKQIYDHFVGIVSYFDSQILVIDQINGKCKSLFFIEHIVSVQEEPQLDPTNPEDLLIIQDLKQKKEQKKEPKSPFIDVTELENLARKKP